MKLKLTAVFLTLSLSAMAMASVCNLPTTGMQKIDSYSNLSWGQWGSSHAKKPKGTCDFLGSVDSNSSCMTEAYKYDCFQLTEGKSSDVALNWGRFSSVQFQACWGCYK